MTSSESIRFETSRPTPALLEPTLPLKRFTLGGTRKLSIYYNYLFLFPTLCLEAQKLKMAKDEFSLEGGSGEKPPGRKGNGMYCSPAMIAFTILTVCVLIAATALLVFYIPDRTVVVDAATKAPQVGKTTVAAVKTPEPANPTMEPVNPTMEPVNPTMEPVRPTTVAPSDLMKGRLPTSVLPRRYELNLRPFLYDDDVPDSKLGQRFTFDGWVRIKVQCMEATDEITLHAKHITIHGMPTVHSVSTLDKTDIFESHTMVEEYAFLVLKLKEMLRPHEEYDIYIVYSGILGDDEAGFYPSMYMDSMNNTRSVCFCFSFA